MNYADLVAEVYTITNRPDRVAETASAIKSATLKAHHSDFYIKDIMECGIQFPTAEYVQNWAYRNDIPNMRAAKYFRLYDISGVTPTAGQKLDPIDATMALDEYGLEKLNVWYAAGPFITIRTKVPYSNFLVGVYLNPIVTQTGYNSWIADDHPYAIIYEAAAQVFKAVGKDEESATYRSMVPEEIAGLARSNILGVGY
jgi:hypothetical protein